MENYTTYILNFLKEKQIKILTEFDSFQVCMTLLKGPVDQIKKISELVYLEFNHLN